MEPKMDRLEEKRSEKEHGSLLNSMNLPFSETMTHKQGSGPKPHLPKITFSIERGLVVTGPIETPVLPGRAQG